MKEAMRFIEVGPPNLSRFAARGAFATPVTMAAATGLALTAHSMNAHAGSIYFETAGGSSSFRSASNSFGPGASASPGFGYSVNNGLFFKFLSEHQLFELHLGTELKLSSTRSGPYDLGYLAPYPEMRIQISRFHIGLGITPFARRRMQLSGGFLDYGYSPATTSILGAAGILWPLSEVLSIGLETSAQSIAQSGAGGARSTRPRRRPLPRGECGACPGRTSRPS